MDEKALFTRFWTKESKTTRNVISRIPESSDYRPDPRSRTATPVQTTRLTGLLLSF